MRIATSTNLFGYHRGKLEYTPTIECLKRSKLAGFGVMDMNFCPTIHAEGFTEFAGDDWLDWAHKIRAAADELGITFNASHLPIYPELSIIAGGSNSSQYERFLEMTHRAIIVGGILGVKWAVAHPFTDTINSEYDNEANLKMNLDFYRPLLQTLKENGQGLALENMAEFNPQVVRRRYCAIAEELVSLVDAFHDTSVGICWDFGHANLMYVDQTRPLRFIGKRLKTTHVDDNKKAFDAHTAPFVCGNIKWEDIMPVLVEIGYEGDFTYEAQRMVDHAPEEIKDDIATFIYHIGEYCLRLAQQ